MKSGAKCRNWGSLGRLAKVKAVLIWLGPINVTQGHRQCHHSIEHMTSYSTLIETVSLSWYRFRDIASYFLKSPILTHPTCIWRRRRG